MSSNPYGHDPNHPSYASQSPNRDRTPPAGPNQYHLRPLHTVPNDPHRTAAPPQDQVLPPIADLVGSGRVSGHPGQLAPPHEASSQYGLPHQTHQYSQQQPQPDYGAPPAGFVPSQHPHDHTSFATAGPSTPYSQSDPSRAAHLRYLATKRQQEAEFAHTQRESGLQQVYGGYLNIFDSWSGNQYTGPSGSDQQPPVQQALAPSQVCRIHFHEYLEPY